jgi:hypothetical protein
LAQVNEPFNPLTLKRNELSEQVHKNLVQTSGHNSLIGTPFLILEQFLSRFSFGFLIFAQLKFLTLTQTFLAVGSELS